MLANKLFVESLQSFLEKTQEDKIVVKGIISEFPDFASQTLEKILKQGFVKILDIGAGNGMKALLLSDYFKNQNIKVILDAVEPKKEQIDLLENHYQNTDYLRTVFDKPFDEAELKETYDIVLVIHSLYEFSMQEDGTFLSMEKIYSCIADDGVIIITMKDTYDDLEYLKYDLLPQLNRNVTISQESIEKTLHKLNIAFVTSKPLEMPFMVDKNKPALDIGYELNFMLSSSLEDRALLDTECEALGNRVLAKVKEKGSPNLVLRDILTWVKK